MPYTYKQFLVHFVSFEAATNFQNKLSSSCFNKIIIIIIHKSEVMIFGAPKNCRRMLRRLSLFVQLKLVCSSVHFIQNYQHLMINEKKNSKEMS